VEANYDCDFLDLSKFTFESLIHLFFKLSIRELSGAVLGIPTFGEVA
jgi:hypothetical protein